MKNRLKEYREQVQMTQKELSEICSVSTRSIISIEKGEYNPCLLLASKMARVFHTTVEDLFCLDDNLQDWQYDRETT